MTTQEHNQRPRRTALWLAGALRWTLVLGLGALAAVAWWRATAPQGNLDKSVQFTCPMHTTYVQDGQGSCPICGMDLVPRAQLAQDASPTADPAVSFRLGDIAGVAPTRIDTGRLQRAGVRTAVVGRRTIQKSLSLSGTVAVDETRRTAVLSRAGGWVQHVTTKRPGQSVHAGEAVAVLYSRELHEAQAEYVASSVVPTSVGMAPTGLRDAAGERLVRLGMSRGAVRALGNAKGVVTVTAPRAGVVLQRPIDTGRYVSAADALLVIADLSVLVTAAEVPADWAVDLVSGQAVTLIGPDGATRQGTLIAPEPEVRTELGSVRWRAEIRNDNGKLWPGQVVTWQLTRSRPEALAVPEDAVVDIGTATYVHRTDGHGHVWPTQVVCGMHAGGWVEVTAGLVDGDRIVTSGAFLVDAEARLAAPTTQLPDLATPTQPMAKAHVPPPEAPLDPAIAEPIARQYLHLQEALLASDAVKAHAAALDLARLLSEKNLVVRGLGDFPTALDAQRQRLRELSEDVIALTRRAGLTGDLRVAWCPMAPGRWLQRGDEVNNPYFGQKMLHCGEIQGTPKTAPADPPAAE